MSHCGRSWVGNLFSLILNRSKLVEYLLFQRVLLEHVPLDESAHVVEVLAPNALLELLGCLRAHPGDAIDDLLHVVDEDERGHLHACERVHSQIRLGIARVEHDHMPGNDRRDRVEKVCEAETYLKPIAVLQVDCHVCILYPVIIAAVKLNHEQSSDRCDEANDEEESEVEKVHACRPPIRHRQLKALHEALYFVERVCVDECCH